MKEVQSIYSKRDDPLAVGVIGAGWISSTFHVPIINYHDKTELSYVADTEWSRARNLANAYGVDPIHVKEDPSVVPDCDIVLLSIPVGIRQQYIQLFSDRSTAIFCEKPIARAYTEHKTYLDTTAAMFANYQRTCYSAPNQLRDILNAEVFGPLKSVTVREGSVGGSDKGIPQDHYRTDLELSGGGVLIEVGCHTLSQLVHIFDNFELSVKDADITYNHEFDTDVSATLACQRAGREIEIDYRVSSIRNIGSGMEFIFENARVTFDPFNPSSLIYVRPLSGGENLDFTMEHDDRWADGKYRSIYLRWEQFVEDLRGKEMPDHVRTAPDVTRLITEIYSQDNEPRQEVLS